MMLTKARSYSPPAVRPTRIVPFGKLHPGPTQSLVNSIRAYELLRSVKITPCVCTGSIVPKGGRTAGVIFGFSIADLSARGWLRLVFTDVARSRGWASSMKRLCVEFAWLCGDVIDN